MPTDTLDFSPIGTARQLLGSVVAFVDDTLSSIEPLEQEALSAALDGVRSLVGNVVDALRNGAADLGDAFAETADTDA